MWVMWRTTKSSAWKREYVRAPARLWPHHASQRRGTEPRELAVPAVRLRRPTRAAPSLGTTAQEQDAPACSPPHEQRVRFRASCQPRAHDFAGGRRASAGAHASRTGCMRTVRRSLLLSAQSAQAGGRGVRGAGEQQGPGVRRVRAWRHVYLRVLESRSTSSRILRRARTGRMDGHRALPDVGAKRCCTVASSTSSVGRLVESTVRSDSHRSRGDGGGSIQDSRGTLQIAQAKGAPACTKQSTVDHDNQRRRRG